MAQMERKRRDEELVHMTHVAEAKRVLEQKEREHRFQMQEDVRISDRHKRELELENNRMDLDERRQALVERRQMEEDRRRQDDERRRQDEKNRILEEERTSDRLYERRNEEQRRNELKDSRTFDLSMAAIKYGRI